MSPSTCCSRRKGPLAPERVVELVAQVCDGLTEAHGVGIVHRDLKPSNIILGKRRDGTELAKILDFGIARVGDTQKTGGSLTQLGIVVGTPAYLAPEQAAADSLDSRTDIYSLGCVAFELLTGQPPFKSDSVQKLMSMHLRDAPPSAAAIRRELATYPALSEVIQRAMSKDRTHRQQSAKELAQALRDSLRAKAIPGAFDDWGPPPAETPGAAMPAGATDSWPPSSATAAASHDWAEPPPAPAAVPAPSADSSWPPQPPIASPQPSVPEVSSFFAFDTGKFTAAAPASKPHSSGGGPKHRLETTIEALKLPLTAAFNQRVAGARNAIEPGTRKAVVLHVEVLRAPVESGQRAACARARPGDRPRARRHPRCAR